jgi:hypothetical protein
MPTTPLDLSAVGTRLLGLSSGQVAGLALPDDLTFERWLEIDRRIVGANSVMWWIGDWWALGEMKYGVRKALVTADGWEGPSIQACQDAATVARRFEPKRRRGSLEFTPHREVAALPADEADALLDEAEREGWSTKKLRAEVSTRRSAAAVVAANVRER